ncbi:transposase [Tepidanaerobacter acetatoxydans Re1]|uniref:Mutator family transposase n=1 Tax=Tepidanaerobacter acetatoxydans (strain DSM 21804 / JCM 16047 / Re1) TaxID=1209989 RepID=F4LXI7_TEPAE|nr:IS256 family transposase [Tepidanaerobacter acetatoxydans]AEE91089.1 transposase mutator type [Tepidanaerobacter acetatoxydans Re1]CCP25723.1 transposase [Tepidanaerobacter acetatoxydans Re1]
MLLIQRFATDRRPTLCIVPTRSACAAFYDRVMLFDSTMHYYNTRPYSPSSLPYTCILIVKVKTLHWIGYNKYDYRNKETDNSRNGYSKKTVQGSLGELEIQVPRDRQGEFEPQLVKKHQTDVSAIEDKVIFLYSQGVSTRDIQKTMREMYGIEVDDSRVSKITDKLLPVIREWQERPLQSVYAMVILDAVHYSVRENGIVTKKAAYVAIGTDLEGKKDALGIKSWRVNWPQLSTMFKYPPEIRTLIYTTNAIENFNRQLRKVTKTKSAFVSDDALMKILYLATMNIIEKWTMPIRNWATILDHLMIYFGDRVDIRI